MKIVLAGLAAMAVATAVGASKPATAMPIQNLASVETKAAGSSVTDVQFIYRRRLWGPRRVLIAPPYPYYAYSYPYRFYRPGPFVRIGPFGFGAW